MSGGGGQVPDREPPCPICMHLDRWYGRREIGRCTHGAGGPDWQWRSCYEHYQVLTAVQWLRILTPPVAQCSGCGGTGGEHVCGRDR